MSMSYIPGAVLYDSRGKEFDDIPHDDKWPSTENIEYPQERKKKKRDKIIQLLLDRKQNEKIKDSNPEKYKNERTRLENALYIAYKEMKNGVHFLQHRNKVSERASARRKEKLRQTPQSLPSSVSSPPPTPALIKESFISPVTCFNVPNGYSLLSGHTTMKMECQIGGKEIYDFNFRIIKE